MRTRLDLLPGMKIWQVRCHKAFSEIQLLKFQILPPYSIYLNYSPCSFVVNCSSGHRGARSEHRLERWSTRGLSDASDQLLIALIWVKVECNEQAWHRVHGTQLPLPFADEHPSHRWSPKLVESPHPSGVHHMAHRLLYMLFQNHN
jgi:hypothetical protein